MDSVAFGRAGLGAALMLVASVPEGARAEGPGGSAMLDRPLFSATRRPPPPPLAPQALSPAAEPGPPPAAPPPDVALSGVILGRGGVALLRRPQDAAPLRLGLGGEIDGWTLAEIWPRAVVLRRDDRSVTVDMPDASR